MNWFYESAGQQQGPVSDSELDALLAHGGITPETRVWHEGMADWMTLREARPSAPGNEELQLGPGFVRCSLTGRIIPETEAVYIQGNPYSAEAKPTVLQIIQRGGRLPELSSERTGPPWENRRELGFFPAAWETIKGVLVQPSQTFRNMKRTGGLGPPLLFYVIFGSIGLVIGLFYEVIGNSTADRWIADEESAGGTFIRELIVGTTSSFGELPYWALAAPFIMALIAFITAGTTHLALMLIQGARQPFEATFRVICYCSGATAAVFVLPFCGDEFATVWCLVLMCIGIAKVHEISTGHATLGVVLPVLACCGVVAVLFAAVGASATGTEWWTQIFE